MTTRIRYFGLILLLIGLPALAADYSADFDRTQLPPATVADLEEGHIKPIIVLDNWLDVLGDVPAPIDVYPTALFEHCKNLMQAGQLDEARAPAWAAEHGIDQADLIAALEIIPEHDITEYFYGPMCAALYDKLGDDPQAYLGFPPKTRLLMVTYLAGSGHEEDAEILRSSLSAVGPDVLPGWPFVAVANALYFQHEGLYTAMWAWKRGAERRDAEYRALVCLQIRSVCKQLGDAELVRQELIPWAEDALARPGSEPYWNRAVSALLWGYEYIGEPEKAIERAQYWLAQAKQRNVPPEKLTWAHQQLAQALMELGDLEQAAAIVAPQFEKVRPAELGAWQQVGEETTRTVLVTGNLTFKVTAATCKLPAVTAVVGERKSDERERQSHYVVTVTFGPRDEAGTYEGTLVIQTNDPNNPAVTLPLAVRVMAK